MYPAIGCVQVYFSNKDSFCWPFVSHCWYNGYNNEQAEAIKSWLEWIQLDPVVYQKSWGAWEWTVMGYTYFDIAFPPSRLLRIVMQPLGARPLHFWCLVEILLWGVITIHGQSLCLWICLAQLSLLLSRMIYGFPWVSLRLNLIFVFPLQLY